MPRGCNGRADAGKESPADGARDPDTAYLSLFASYTAENKATQERREVLVRLWRPVIYYLKLREAARSALTCGAACSEIERIRFVGARSGPGAGRSG